MPDPASPWFLLPPLHAQGCTVEDLFLHLSDLHAPLLDTLRPASEAQLAALEAALQVRLPPHYRATLRLAGSGWGDLLRETVPLRLLTVDELRQHTHPRGLLVVGFTGERCMGDLAPERLLLDLTDDEISAEEGAIAEETLHFLARLGLSRFALALRGPVAEATSHPPSYAHRPPPRWMPHDFLAGLEAILRAGGLERHPLSGGRHLVYLSDEAGVIVTLEPWHEGAEVLVRLRFSAPPHLRHVPPHRSRALALVRAAQAAPLLQGFAFSDRLR